MYSTILNSNVFFIKKTQSLPEVRIVFSLTGHVKMFLDHMVIAGWPRLPGEPDSVEHLWPHVGQSRGSSLRRRNSGS